MIRHRSFLLLFSAFAFRLAAAEAYSLTEAIQKNLVVATIKGAEGTDAIPLPSSHYGACISLELTSKATADLRLSLDYGFSLLPEDTSVQTMMVTQTLIVQLAPKQKKKYAVYAMCTEAHNNAPSSSIVFAVGKRFGGNLLRLAELIQRKKYQHDAGQKAVWCLTNDYPLSSIESSDTAAMYELRRFIAQIKKIPMSEVYKNYSEQPPPKMIIRTTAVYSGSLRYNVIGYVQVLLALYDEDGKMKVVYVNEKQREGQYAYDYKVNGNEIGNKKHYLRLFRDGKMIEEVSIIPRE